jgi:peptidoglycan/LPS O-acetylase OafA/YrhL
MKAHWTLLALLLAITAVSTVDSYLHAHQIREPGWWHLSATLALSLLIFGWYYFDSESRSYPRSTLLNIAVLGVAIVAIPYYLARSREKGKRLKAIIGLLGFCVLSIVFAALGQVLGDIVG